jgi:signal transduction histidine kinase
MSERKQAEQISLSSVATVSHELRTPLTSIKGALRLLESGSPAISAMTPRAWSRSRGATATVCWRS